MTALDMKIINTTILPGASPFRMPPPQLHTRPMQPLVCMLVIWYSFSSGHGGHQCASWCVPVRWASFLCMQQYTQASHVVDSSGVSPWPLQAVCGAST